MNEQNKIVIYQTEDGQTQIDVRMENETVWLSTNQMALLFNREESNIRRHIINVFKEGELPKDNNVHFLHVNGVKKLVPFYNLMSFPKTNREFWVEKIRRNKERDRKEQRQLAKMGWHCITVWECELKPAKREETLESLAFTLNHIFLQDRRGKMEDIRSEIDESTQMPVAAEER